MIFQHSFLFAGDYKLPANQMPDLKIFVEKNLDIVREIS